MLAAADRAADRSRRAEALEAGRIGFDTGSNIPSRVRTADHDHGHGASSYICSASQLDRAKQVPCSVVNISLPGPIVGNCLPRGSLACELPHPIELAGRRPGIRKLGRGSGGNLRPNELIQAAAATHEDPHLGPRLLWAGFQPSHPHRTPTCFARRAIGMNCFLYGHGTYVTLTSDALITLRGRFGSDNVRGPHSCRNPRVCPKLEMFVR